MAFANCFYVKVLDPNNSLYLSANNEDISIFALDWQYGYEKPDGSEPDWMTMINPDAGNEIELPSNTKVYLKGNSSLAFGDESQTQPSIHGLGLRGSSAAFQYGLEIGGSPQSLVWDGDGNKTAVKYSPDGVSAYIIGHLFKDFQTLPLDIGNLILPPVDFPFYYEQLFSKSAGLKNIPTTLVQSTNPATGMYRGMFSRGNITVAPKGFLKATALETRGCYSELFLNCAGLNEIWVDFIDWSEDIVNSTENWVSGVAATGVFHCPESLPQIFDDSHIPVGWTVETFPDPKKPSRPFKVIYKKNYISGGRKKA